jgi:hypothetical protein
LKRYTSLLGTFHVSPLVCFLPPLPIWEDVRPLVCSLCATTCLAYCCDFYGLAPFHVSVFP